MVIASDRVLFMETLMTALSRVLLLSLINLFFAFNLLANCYESGPNCIFGESIGYCYGIIKDEAKKEMAIPSLNIGAPGDQFLGCVVFSRLLYDANTSKMQRKCDFELIEVSKSSTSLADPELIERRYYDTYSYEFIANNNQRYGQRERYIVTVDTLKSELVGFNEDDYKGGVRIENLTTGEKIEDGSVQFRIANSGYDLRNIKLYSKNDFEKDNRIFKCY